MINFYKAGSVFFATFFFLANGFSKEWVAIKSVNPTGASKQLISSDINSTVLKFTVEGFYKRKLNAQKGEAYSIELDNTTPILEQGSPDLPKISTSIIIPDKSEMEVEVLSSSYQEYEGINVIPSKGHLNRGSDPSLIAYAYNQTYRENRFWPHEQTYLRKPYILRDFRGQTVVVQPFCYNPVTKVLRVYNEIVVHIYQKNNNPSHNQLERKKLPGLVDGEFAEIYKRHFVNWNLAHFTPADESGELLIICPSKWINLMQPFVEWKIQKGIPTTMVDLATIGNSSLYIKNFIADYYSTHNITHTLLIGDADDLPAILPLNLGGASDPAYGYILGEDSYPEVFIGRFSAATDDELQTQVDRVINYEKTPDPSMQWYDKGICIGSNQGPGDDNEMDWQHETNIRADLLGYNYLAVAELYDGTHSSTTDLPGNPVAADVQNLIQTGVGIINYTGHGSNNGWTTTDFSSSNVNALTNENKLPFIWSVACLNGNFTDPSGPCFAETLLRSHNTSSPTGAIATMMSSNNQSWNPPMDGQDEMNDILVESYATNIKRTFGGISYNGCIHMNDQYGDAGALVTDSWNCFGDPTLNVRTAVPGSLTVNHPPSVPLGTSSLYINCNFDGAYVSLTFAGQIIKTGVITSGSAKLHFSPLLNTGSMTLTVTGVNKVPYIGTILVSPSAGPYVIYQSNVNFDLAGNNDGNVDYSEQISTDLILQNVGLSAANNLSLSVSTDDLYVIINSVSTNLVNIQSFNNTLLTNAFTYTVSNSVPDQHEAEFKLVLSDASGSIWSSSYTQVINAPELKIKRMHISDSILGNNNHALEPGESASVIVEIENSGHSDSKATTSFLNSSNQFVQINNGTFPIGILASNQSVLAEFSISLSSSIPSNDPYDFDCKVVDGFYSDSRHFYANAGILHENFESGTFDNYNWTNAGNQPWFVTGYHPYEGTYCSQSGNINDSETSILSVNLNVLMEDSLTFFYKVSSEPGKDYFKIYLDGIQQQEWSGAVAWNRYGLIIPAGQHLLTFSFEKDLSNSMGLDAAWIDQVNFPPLSTVTSMNTSFENDNLVSVFPNPAQNELNILFKNSFPVGNLSFQLINMQGSIVMDKEEKSQFTSENILSVSLQDIMGGIYMLKLSDGVHTCFKKVIVAY